MSLKLLRRKAPAAPAAPDATVTAELERARREASAARAASERVAKELEAARKETLDARAAAAAQHLDAAIGSAAAKARAINPSHVVALTRDRYELVDGKVRAKADPTKDLDADLAEWLGSDGKHFVPAVVPGGGAGAPASPATPAIGAPHDLASDTGRTAYAASVEERFRARHIAS